MPVRESGAWMKASYLRDIIAALQGYVREKRRRRRRIDPPSSGVLMIHSLVIQLVIQV